MAKLEQRGFATSFISTKPDEAIEKWMTQLLPSRELTYPTLGKGKSSSKCHFWGYVSSLEGNFFTARIGRPVCLNQNLHLEVVAGKKGGKSGMPSGLKKRSPGDLWGFRCGENS